MSRPGALGRTIIPAAVAPSRFPVRAHASGRYLVDARGAPFPILGRVCWTITRLSRDGWQFVIADSVEKGFTAIECKPPMAPEGYQFDSDGNLPFTHSLDGTRWNGEVIPYANIGADAPDFTRPNEAFWSRVDTFFKDCESRGLLVFYFPLYVGFHNTDWWMEMMVANGAAKCQAYGAWVARRYADRQNLVWMLGGDKGTGAIPFSAGEAAVVEALNTGLQGVNRQCRLQSSEWLRGSVSKDLYPASISLNGAYADTLDINNQGARAWAASPAIPAYFQEYPAEESGSPGIMRRMAMWAWLSTIGGYFFMNGVFTDFTAGVYTSHMNTQGTLDCKRLNAFIRTINWHLLSPDNSAIAAGGGTANQETQVACASASNGSLLLAYCPPSHTGTVTIAMTRMSGTTTARWWDPTNGTYTAGGSGFANTGTRAFTKPGNNSAGDADWLLVLTA